VTSEEGTNSFPLNALPTSWWTRPRTGSMTMIDTQTGEPMRVRVANMGSEILRMGGRSVSAERVRVQGTLTVDLWYDADGRWIGCNFTARGQDIAYQLNSGPA
jgi:hypothetical protein